MHTFFARKSCKQISAISSKVLSSCRVREYTADSPVSSFLSIMEKVSVKAALIDLSGTLHIEDVATDGAQAALKRFYSLIKSIFDYTFCITLLYILLYNLYVTNYSSSG